MKLDWGAWIYGMWMAVAGGAANSVVAGMGLLVIAPGEFTLQQGRFWGYIFGLFVLSGVKDFFIYIAQHPAPAILREESVATISQPGQPTVTVATVKDTSSVPIEAGPPKQT